MSHMSTQQEKEWRRWVEGRMRWSGPRAITGLRRTHVIAAQGRMCADPFGRCALAGAEFPEMDGHLVCEVDHIVPWHVDPDSSLPNLQALCPTCHSMKSYVDGSWD